MRLQAGASEAALNYWIKADSLSPGNLFFQTKKAMAYYRNGNWPETIESAQTVFQSDSVPVLLRMTGDACQNLNDPILANYYYTKAYEQNPSDHLSLSNICEYFYAMGEDGYDTVAVMTEKFLNEVNPHQKKIGQLNGMANYSSGRFDEAIDRLKKNVELGDSSYTTTYFLGMSNYAKNWHYQAVKWLGKAFEINNKDIQILYYYGTALGRVKNREEAVKVLQAGIDGINRMSEMLYGFDISMAEAYQNTNGYLKAVEYYSSAYKRQPDQHNLLYSIARAYDLAKEYNKAVTAYERFLKTSPDDVKTDNAPSDKKDGPKQIGINDLYYRSALQRVKELKDEMFLKEGKK